MLKSLLILPIFYSAFFTTNVSAQFLCKETKKGEDCFSMATPSKLFVCREIKSGEKIYRDGPCNVKTERTLSDPSPATEQEVPERTPRPSLSPEQAAKEALVAQMTNPGNGVNARIKSAAILLRYRKRPITKTTALTASYSEKLAMDFLISIASDENSYGPRAAREAATILLGTNN